jgi:meiotic recombination protein SPO11
LYYLFVTGANACFRDIYYQDPDLFLRQDVVDRYVDDIAYTLKIRREDLNIVRHFDTSSVYLCPNLTLQVAAAKGLVAGQMTIIQKDGKIIDCRVDDEVKMQLPH